MAVEATLSMQDIAQLAQVSRQAVTNWRRRPVINGRSLPFPRSIAIVDGVEHFSRGQVLSWLEESGRGKNREAREDAPALSVPDGLHIEDVVTFMALRASSDEHLTGKDEAELSDLAAMADPDDLCLRSEVRALGANEALARYADALMEASYGPADALDRVYSSRLARRRGERGLTTVLVDLLVAATATCRDCLNTDTATLDPRVDSRTAGRLASGFAGVNITSTDARGRDLRRHLVLEEVELVEAVRPTVRVLSVVGANDDETLDAVDQLALDLDPRDIAIVLGSSAALCDTLRGEPAKRREETLGMGRLVMAVRLPRGQWKEAHRQSLALWVLKGDASAERVVVADLSSASIDLGDLASDLTAALKSTSARSTSAVQPGRHLDRGRRDRRYLRRSRASKAVALGARTGIRREGSAG